MATRDAIAAELERHQRALELLLADANEPATPYYTQHDSPLGKRLHLKAIRAGDLTGWRRGRKVFAYRTDVHQYIESNKVEAKPRGPGNEARSPEGRFLPKPAPAKLGSVTSVGLFLEERGIV